MESQRSRDLPLGEILIARGALTEGQLLDALAIQFGTTALAASECTPDPALAPLLPAALAIRFEAVPLRRAGAALVIMTSRPERGEDIRQALDHDGPVLLALASRADTQAAITRIYGQELARLSEARTPVSYSCRGWRTQRAARVWAAICIAVLTAVLFWPTPMIATIFALAVFISGANLLLRALALGAAMRPAAPEGSGDMPGIDAITPETARQPVVTILVPLFNEPDIAGALLRRLERLDYPRDLLDVLLLVEQEDAITRHALAAADLPAWMRAIVVPPGTPRTKPRAMNYGLYFARGSIVGVYDAEDAPEPDQIRKIATRFAQASDDVVCLQGQLDFYNPHHNWLSRSFTLEYAAWFRVLLPGVDRLGLFVPLGGTTLFFRRSVLEEMGAWDAHNVTEDADLGLRLARCGYRTEIVDTTTFEEANAAIVPWIKQRSRWLKGYAMTWATHMRDPLQLWRDLGPRKFVGLQVQVLFTILGFALSPLLWTLIVKPFGQPHALDHYLGGAGYLALWTFFLFSLMLSIYVFWRAARLPRHRTLRLWIPVLDIYFMFASIATLLGLAELLIKPFHWRKTAHGRYSEFGQAEAAMNAQTAPASSFSRTSNAVER